ncbi:MAG: hypothetical protein EKK47_07090 [Burkholderiales bacterium]|jgi:hypothetical protein|nr:MAG: hypothetical protein EKK47_07090 [Burkholderiales bacterium]
MCASKLIRHVSLTFLLASVMLAAAHAEGDREQEQVRRLKMQLRQIQQQQDAAIQEVKTKADADKAAMEKSLKSAESDVASQRAAAGAASRKVKALNEEVESLKKDKEQLSVELAQLKQYLEDSKAKAVEQQGQSAQTIASWQGKYKQMSDANDRCRANNAELYTLGTDLLGKYENKGLREVVSANEPFLGIARVKLENIKAEYQDKLDALRLNAAAQAEAKP